MPTEMGGFEQLSLASSPAAPVFVNDDERAAFKAGRMYVFTTGNNNVEAAPGLSVAAGSRLNIRLFNAGTVNWYIAQDGRLIDSTSTVITTYYGVANPDALTTAQAATLSAGNSTQGNNLYPGKPAQTDITMTFGVGSQITVGGNPPVATGIGLIYPGVKNMISKPRVIPPNTGFAQVLIGQGGTGAIGGTAAISLLARLYLYRDA